MLVGCTTSGMPPAQGPRLTSENENRIFVIDTTSLGVAAIDTETMTVTAHVRVGDRPWSVALVP